MLLVDDDQADLRAAARRSPTAARRRPAPSPRASAATRRGARRRSAPSASRRRRRRTAPRTGRAPAGSARSPGPGRSRCARRRASPATAPRYTSVLPEPVTPCSRNALGRIARDRGLGRASASAEHLLERRSAGRRSGRRRRAASRSRDAPAGGADARRAQRHEPASLQAPQRRRFRAQRRPSAPCIQSSSSSARWAFVEPGAAESASGPASVSAPRPAPSRPACRGRPGGQHRRQRASRRRAVFVGHPAVRARPDPPGSRRRQHGRGLERAARREHRSARRRRRPRRARSAAERHPQQRADRTPSRPRRRADSRTCPSTARVRVSGSTCAITSAGTARRRAGRAIGCARSSARSPV